MVQTLLPAVEVVRRYIEESFDPPLPALWLRWEGGANERLWELPEGVTVVGPAPQKFGFRVQRFDVNAYTLHLLWDRSRFHWTGLSRAQVLTSALAPVLAALGIDLWCLLDQSAGTVGRVRSRAA